MTAKARFTQADITRVLQAAKRAGLQNFLVRIAPCGEITLQVSDNPIEGPDEWSDLDY